jgi:outer membrane protein TolC
MSRLLLLAAAVLFPASIALSSELTLTEFMLRYVKTDKELEASRLRLEAARTLKDSKSYLPPPTLRLDLTSPSYSWRRSYTYQYYLDELYRGYLESEDRAYRVSMTLNQRLPTGGDLSVTGSTNRDRTEFSYGGFPAEIPIERETGDRQFLTDLGLRLNQPLFGPWDRRGEVRRAAVDFRRDRVQHRLDAADALRRGVNAFFGHLVAQARLMISRRALELAEAAERDARSRFAEGLIGEVELLEASISANQARMDADAARRTLARSVRELRVVDRHAPPSLKPEDLTAVLPGATAEGGLDTSPRVALARHEVEVARVALAQARRRRFGDPSLSLWYGFQGIGESFAEARDEFGRNRWGGSLSLGITLPDPGLSADIEMAQAKLRSAEAARERALEETVEERGRLKHKMEVLQADLKLRRRQVDLLESLLIIKRKQFGEDVISLEDLIEYEVRFQESRIYLLETMRDLGLAWVDRALASGANPVELFLRAGTQKNIGR